MLIISALGVFMLWAVIAITLIGVGSSVLSLFHTNYALGDAFWMGLGVSVAVLEIWSLVSRISFGTTLCLCGIAARHLLFNGSILSNQVRSEWQANRRWIVLLRIRVQSLGSLKFSCAQSSQNAERF